MSITQISIFLENKVGQLAQVCKVLADNDVSLVTLSLAETADFGIARLVVDDTAKAEDVLRSPEARKVLLEVLSIIGGEKAAEMDDGMIAMMGSMTVLRAINLMGAVGKRPDKETLLELNRRLNGIKKV